MSGNHIQIMHKMFKEQHRQLIDEQKKMLDGYKQYFETILQEMETKTQKAAPVKEESPDDVAKEIAEIGRLLDDAVKTYGKELAEICSQLSDKQKKRFENLDRVTEESKQN